MIKYQIKQKHILYLAKMRCLSVFFILNGLYVSVYLQECAVDTTQTRFLGLVGVAMDLVDIGLTIAELAQGPGQYDYDSDYCIEPSTTTVKTTSTTTLPPPPPANEFTKFIEGSDLVECQDCRLVLPKNSATTSVSKDGECRCDVGNKRSKEHAECACCFRVKMWDFRFCVAAALDFKRGDLYFLLTGENVILHEMRVHLDPWLPSLVNRMGDCIFLGAPVHFTMICTNLTLLAPSKTSHNHYILCVSFTVGIFGMKTIRVSPPCAKVKNATILRELQFSEQRNPKEDVVLSSAAVLDNNFRPMVCLMNSGRVGKVNFGFDALQSKTKEISRKISWRPTKRGETPFMAVLHDAIFPQQLHRHHGDIHKYQFIWKTVKPSERWIDNARTYPWAKPARTCGGALLTPNKVMTICSCVKSFFYINVLKKSLPPRNSSSDKDFDILGTDIYVDPSGVTYNARNNHKLVKENTPFMDVLKRSRCGRMLAEKKISIPVEGVSEEPVLVVLMFAPEMKNFDPSQFVSWPPPIVENPKEVEMVGFGFRPKNLTWLFRGESEKYIDFREEAVNLYMKSCKGGKNLTKVMKNETYFHPAGGKPVSICAMVNHYQLCGGGIGHPIITGTDVKQFIGLSISAPDCDKSKGHPLLVAIFTEEALDNIYDSMSRGTAPTPHLVTSLHRFCALLTLPTVLSLLLQRS